MRLLCEQPRAQVHRIRNSCLQSLLGATLGQRRQPWDCKLTLFREPIWASAHPFAAGLTLVWLIGSSHSCMGCSACRMEKDKILRKQEGVGPS